MKNQFNEIKRFRLDSMPNAQCHVSIEYSEQGINCIKLVSYETNVVEIVIINNESLREKYKFAGVVYCSPGNGSDSYNCSDWTYSPTTARHINRFTREFFGENMYYQVKHCTENYLPGTEKCFVVYSAERIVARAKWYLENGKRYNWKY